MKRLYETAAYDGSDNAGNFWRSTMETPAPAPALDRDIDTEVAIIGGGYTGLSTALHLARDHGIGCAVLEGQRIGWGASGRNGGFVCLGGAKASASTLARRHGVAAVREFYHAQRQAVELVRQTLNDYEIDADTHSDGELVLAHNARAMKGLQAEADELQHLAGLKSTLFTKEELPSTGLRNAQFEGGMRTPLGFALNPLKYVTGLAAAVRTAGVDIFENSAVEDIEHLPGQGYRLRTSQGQVRARKLVLATNGYSSEDVPTWLRGRYLPVLSNIVVTRALSAAEIADMGWHTDLMAYDTRNLLHYFRLLPQGRFLFGMRGASNVTAASMQQMQRDLRRDFDAMFPACAHVEFEHFWSGLACLARDLTLYVGRISDWPGAYTSIAYHGNGVALGSYCGKLLAGLVAGQPNPAVPAVMTGPLRRFPLPRFRRSFVPAAYKYYNAKDKW
jgi:glycine/D-amino acid oxidase-like deaminating enzyme